jgi:hypothetical protein
VVVALSRHLIYTGIVACIVVQHCGYVDAWTNPCRARLKRDGTRTETRFGLSEKWTSPFKLVGNQFSRLLAVEECGSADRPWIDHVPSYGARLVATLSNRLFPLHFPSDTRHRVLSRFERPLTVVALPSSSLLVSHAHMVLHNSTHVYVVM